MRIERMLLEWEIEEGITGEIAWKYIYDNMIEKHTEVELARCQSTPRGHITGILPCMSTTQLNDHHVRVFANYTNNTTAQTIFCHSSYIY